MRVADTDKVVRDSELAVSVATEMSKRSNWEDLEGEDLKKRRVAKEAETDVAVVKVIDGDLAVKRYSESENRKEKDQGAVTSDIVDVKRKEEHDKGFADEDSA
jgi:hypothetical protein